MFFQFLKTWMPHKDATNPLYDIAQSVRDEKSQKAKAAYYDQCEADEQDKHDYILSQFKDAQQQLIHAAQQGALALEMSAELKSTWDWPTSPQKGYDGTKSAVMRKITSTVKEEVNIPGVTWDAFCPEYDRHKQCIGQGEKRPESDCATPHCFITAKWSKN